MKSSKPLEAGQLLHCWEIKGIWIRDRGAEVQFHGCSESFSIPAAWECTSTWTYNAADAPQSCSFVSDSKVISMVCGSYMTREPSVDVTITESGFNPFKYWRRPWARHWIQASSLWCSVAQPGFRSCVFIWHILLAYHINLLLVQLDHLTDKPISRIKEKKDIYKYVDEYLIKLVFL